MKDLPQGYAGQTVSTEKFHNDYLTPLTADTHQNTVIFLQDKVSTLIFIDLDTICMWAALSEKVPSNMVSTLIFIDLDTICIWAALSEKVPSNMRKCTHSDHPAYAQTIIQGPVVQSVISLTSSLRVISLTVLAD